MSRAKKKLEIVYRKIAELRPDPDNAREHSPEQIASIRHSIREFGFTNPILLKPDDTVGVGNGRMEAARLEGMREVPTITIPGLTKKQWRAYAIADNKLALGATWNEETLKLTLTDLHAGGLDLSVIGFTNLELGRLEVPGFNLAKKETKAQLNGMAYAVIVRCKDETEQKVLLKRFEGEGFKVEALIS